MSEDRNEAGQFTSAEPLYGVAGVEAEAGYSPMPTHLPGTEPEEPSELTLDDAAALLAQEQSDPIPIAYLDKDGKPLNPDPNEGPVATVTLEQAADDKAAYDQGVVDHRASSISQEFAEMVQKMRDEVLTESPELAVEYGIQKSKSAETDPLDAVEGLDEDARAYLKSPQIRTAIEQEFSQAEQAKQQYSHGLEQARVTSLAALYEVVPHLAGLPPAQVEQGLAVLAQVDPPAFQQAMNILGQTQQIVQAQAQAQQQTQQAQRQEFEAQRQEFEAQRQQFSKLADEALGPMTRAEKVQMVDELVDYVGQFGVSREQFAQEAETNLVLHHPAFQRMAADAVKYQRIMKAGKAVPTRQVPQVQHPGVARSRAEMDGADRQALYRQLDSARSESEQLKIAARIIGGR